MRSGLKFIRGAAAAALGAILAMGSAMAQDSTLQKILSSGTLRVGTTGDYNPMTIFDPATKSYKGYEIEAAQKLAADLGVKLEFVRTDWKTLIQGLTSDKYDILMSGTSLSVGRLKVVSFSQPYNTYFMVGLALKDKADKFKSWDDVNKKDVKVAVTLGTNFEGIAKEVLPQASLVRIEAPAREYQEVLAGRSDIGLTSSTEAAGRTRAAALTSRCSRAACSGRGHASAAATSRGPCRAGWRAWRGGRITATGEKGREDGDNRDPQGHEGDEPVRRQVDSEAVAPLIGLGHRSHEECGQPEREHQRQGGSHGGDGETLGQQLPNEPATACAEG